jgi:hypothetical protein
MKTVCKDTANSIGFLPRVEAAGPLPCKICGGDSHLFDVVDFAKFCDQSDYYSFGLSGIPVYYRKCQDCELIFTAAFDHLDKQGFSELVYNSDYVKFDPDYVEKRPSQNADFLADFLGPIKASVRGLDYGSGNGLTAAILSERGWSFSACDPISNPVAVSESFGNFNVISAIEVFEHIPFPVSGMEDLLSYAADDCLLIIGTLATDNQVTGSRLDWWYAGPRNGHITLHSKASLRLLFNRYGFSYYSPNNSLHVGVRGNPPDPRFVQVLQASRPFTWKKLKRWLARRIAAR